ncbi:hypothetical protein [Peptoniphilus sp.]|jgi:predicted nucleotide-binding protein (sugar kinase/HSP70/actin superfamily)|uniref:hypothetical protein n=1 Tax=Peptoniphilus sp. TaxID=1971214 RepID=UPI003D8C2223
MTRKVTFPQLGNYNIPIEMVFEEGMGVKYLKPPKISNKTLEIGSKYSPDSVCAPFKFMLGNYIEAIENGAEILVSVGGLCRLGYYGELHQQIIKDLGYDVTFVNFAQTKLSKPSSWYEKFKTLNPDMSLIKIGEVIPVFLKMIEYLDITDNFMRKNAGFEVEEGSFDRLYKKYLQEMRDISSLREIKDFQKKYMKAFKELPVNKPKNPLRVAMIGEYYTIMEPFSNHYIEKWLAERGIEIERWMNLTNTIIDRPEKEVKNHIKPYAKYDLGATSMYTIDRALRCAKAHYDGIIHVKSAGCMPEIDAMAVLQNISKDYKIPILYISFDSQTSDVGLQTRLEAFYDMIMMRKEKII